MLTTSRRTSAHFGVDRVEFREGLAEALPLPDCWADVVISNGVINLCVCTGRRCSPRSAGCSAPGAGCSFADIANGRPVPVEATRNIDLWTG
jgi:hypothetical protein